MQDRSASVAAIGYDIVPQGLAVHVSQIHSLAATKNMKYLFTGAEDGFIRKYNFIQSMNGDQLLVAAQKHSLVDSIQKAGVLSSAWELEEIKKDTLPQTHDSSQQNILVPSQKTSPVYSMQAHSEAVFLLAGCESGAINLYTVRHDEGTCQHVLNGHTKPVSALSLNGSERIAMSGSWDRAVMTWDLETGTKTNTLTCKSHISSLEYQPSSALLAGEYTGPSVDESVGAILSFDGRLAVVDWRDSSSVGGGGKRFEVASGVPPWGISMVWSSDGKKIYVGRRNGTVDEWDVGQGQVIQNIRLPRDSGPVTSVQCLPNDRHLVIASHDNIRLWDLQYTPPDATADAASLASGGTDTDLFNHPVVPFSIIPGHHGGMISNLLVDWSGRYMVSTSGNRGWEGQSSNMCLLYTIKPIQSAAGINQLL